MDQELTTNQRSCQQDATYGDGKIILDQADATVVALDAKTGKELWKVANGDAKKGETMTSAPMVVKDKVIVGISGGEFGVLGRLTALNLKDGTVAWKANSVGRMTRFCSIRRKPPIWASRLAPIRRCPLGRATSGKPVAAPLGAGIRTTLS